MNPTAQWQTELFVLHEKDIRAMSEPAPLSHPDPERASAIRARTLLSGGALPDGSHAVSWIWRGAPTSADAISGYNEGLPFPSQLFNV